LSGGGTLALWNNGANRIYSSSGTGDTLVNSAGNTIQGSGQIGINSGSYAFTLNNAGIINANQSSALNVFPTNTVTNTGTLEATNGATLNLSATVTNTGGTIQATGANSLVELNGSTINGGTLTTASGGTVQNSGTATLNGVTISNGSTFTAVNGSQTYLQGTFTNNGTIAQNSTGSDTDLILNHGITLGGTLAMSNNFANRIYGNSSFLDNALTNNGTIQGSGQIGINSGSYAFTLTNNGTINANQSGGMQVAPSGTVTNTNLIEATNGATLNLIATVTNTGGTIQATGTGSLVELNGSAITGGTLTTSGGGTVQNSGSATLDGVTISNGSTVTLLNGTSTTLLGTIINNGTIAQNSTGSDTDLHISGNVTLDGTGVLALSNNFANRIYATGSDSLTNGADHTIEGAGQIGINSGSYAFTLTNNGTILANQSNTLQVASGGNMTNNGTFQANSGSLLNVIGNLTNYSPTTNTLTGGTYNAYSGTIQLSQADATAITPAVITTNAATILLDGATAKIADGSGNNILQGFFTTNAAAGNFTIQNGANLTSSSSDFSNAGTLTVGANSTFTVGGSHNFNNSGLLEGIGTVQASLLSNSGTVHPGDGPGILTVTGSYAQTSTGALGIQIGGSSAGTGFSQLNISGSASLAGTLDLSLINGFIPSNGETFEILTSSGLSGTFSTVNGLQEGNVTFTVAYTSDDVVLDAHVSSSAVPEPASWLMLGLGLTAVGTCVVRKSKSQVRGK
jgi:hypothetical protein